MTLNAIQIKAAIMACAHIRTAFYNYDSYRTSSLSKHMFCRVQKILLPQSGIMYPAFYLDTHKMCPHSYEDLELQLQLNWEQSWAKLGPETVTSPRPIPGESSEEEAMKVTTKLDKIQLKAKQVESQQCCKPFIVKAWTPDMEFSKDELRPVSIWIRLPGLDFKYWSQKGLSEIGSCCGETTNGKYKLQHFGPKSSDYKQTRMHVYTTTSQRSKRKSKHPTNEKGTYRVDITGEERDRPRAEEEETAGGQQCKDDNVWGRKYNCNFRRISLEYAIM
ncbi:hypothetical protein BC332_02803 [Capsicum chinense]|nr:hypothetical protein BC332_02803 [Capsicum chinense]